jgi:hypothetical protein
MNSSFLNVTSNNVGEIINTGNDTVSHVNRSVGRTS